MSGNRYILDTNAVIFLLKGNKTLLNSTEKTDGIGSRFQDRQEIWHQSNKVTHGPRFSGFRFVQ